MKKLIFGGIAILCAVGTGMLAAATVISTPASLLLLIGAGFIVSFSLPWFLQYLSRLWVADRLDTRALSHQKYIRRLLARRDSLDQINPKYARHLTPTQAFFSLLGSIVLSLAVAGIAYGLLSLVSQTVLIAIVAGCMFMAMSIVTLINYYHGLKDVWDGREKVIDTFGELSTGLRSGIVIFVISALAAGLMIGSMVMDGVHSTLGEGISWLAGLAPYSGPLGWIVFAAVSVSAFALMSFGLFDLMDAEKRAAKLDMFRSFFYSTEDYQAELQQQWTQVNQDLDAAEQAYDGTPASKLALNKLYAQKDAIYHRYTAYSKPWFNTVYKISTVIVFAVSIAGMFMHVARGFQSMNAIGLTQKLSSAIMYLSMIAEGFFTGVIVTSTMNEEAMLGKQTTQYEDHLAKQEGKVEVAQANAYQASRGMHFLFDLMLGLFGAEGGEHGHGTKTGISYADNEDLQTPLGIGMGLKAGLERHGGDSHLLTFRYSQKGEVTGIEEFEETPEDSYFNSKYSVFS